MYVDNGGSAFPSHGTMGERLQEGITARDYFAAKALQGMCSDPEFDKTPEETARLCYRAADAMLEERSKP